MRAEMQEEMDSNVRSSAPAKGSTAVAGFSAS